MMRRTSVAAALCIVVCVGLLCCLVAPARAQAGPPWGNEDAFVSYLRRGATERDTAVVPEWVDLGPDNVTRSHLEAAVPVLAPFGYGADFARCAVETTIRVEEGDQRPWYYREPGNFHNVLPVPLSQFFSPGATLQVFKYGNAFVAKACANFSVPPVMLGALRVRKFSDPNMNGVWDAGERSLTWPVSYSGAASGGGLTELVHDVLTGSYRVTETLQPGWAPTTATAANVTVTACRTTSVLFGNVELGSIAGIKWNDTNCNGVVDEGEAPLPGWEISLVGRTVAGGDVEPAPVVTNEAGEYLFDNLYPSDSTGYRVSETLKDDEEWGPTWPLEPGLTEVPEYLGPWPHTAVLEAGAHLTDLSFGNVRLGSISGVKFYDANPELPVNDPRNGNGVYDPGEPLLEDWAVGISGYCDLMLPIVPRTTYTDEQGGFTFPRLYPTHVEEGYAICEELPEGWLLTSPQLQCRTTHLDEGEQITAGFEFGNLAVIDYGLRTIGYWKNHPEAITRDMYRGLSSLPAFSGINNWKKLEPILWEATAQDMAVMLRAQLAAMELNVLAGMAPMDATVYVGDIPGAPELFGGNIVYLGTILTVVESSYPWSGWSRATQEAAKDALDNANNNESTVSLVPL